MLKELYIKNIVLIDSAQISFGSGLHIFSGETGAGKTAILHALRLILGAKADTQLIRKGEESAKVTALFEIQKTSPLFSILIDSGIDIDFDDDFIIKREVNSKGKNRSFINDQLVQSGLLKEIAPYLVQVVAQHASHDLFDTNAHRKLLDLFGKNQLLTQSLSESYSHLSSLKLELDSLANIEKNQSNLNAKWSDELDEIEKAQINSNEEENNLFEEYEKLTHTQDLIESLSSCYNTLRESDNSTITILNKEFLSLKKINISNSQFLKIQQEFQEALESLNELSFSILSFKDSVEEDPQRIIEIEERIKLIRSICKRFGPKVEDVLKYKSDIENSLNQFDKITEKKERILKKIESEQSRFNLFCKELSLKRVRTKELLQKKIYPYFNELNLPHAKLEIELTQINPNQHGSETIEFFLKVNKGENRVSLKDKISGGELSRLLLALKAVISEFEDVPTLFFDEVDANLGGETAPKVGKLLKKMSQNKQIIAITHLPQVAAYADWHFQIHKEEEKNRTFSLIKRLDQKQKLKEIERMLGGRSFSQKASELAVDLLQSSKP